MADLIRERRQGDWNELIGLRNAVLALLGRAVVATAAWAFVVFLLSPVIVQAPSNGYAGRAIAIIAAIPGSAIGYFMARRISEIAGFVSVIITMIALAATLAVTIGGVQLAHLFRPLPHYGGWIAATVSLIAGGWVVWIAVADH